MDCLEGMKQLDDNSVDLIVTDPPYDSTNNEWDKEPNWDIIRKQFNRILKKNGTIFIFGKQPMLTNLINSFTKCFNFRFELIWYKNAGMWSSDFKPLQLHENILCFSKKIKVSNLTWNLEDIKIKGKPYKKLRKPEVATTNQGDFKKYLCINDGFRFPITVLEFQAVRGGHPEHKGHPTQKPEGLIRWLIKASSNKKEIVLDPFMGSGTTAICCKQLNRNFVGFEINKDYMKIANERLQQQTLILVENE